MVMEHDGIGPGKFVSLTYSITDSDGHVVEQSDLPVSYIFGGEVELIGGMDAAITGKKEGDSVDILLSPEQAFGARDSSLTYTDDINNVPPPFRHLGAEVSMQNEAGEIRVFYVTRIQDGKLTLDGNHPLAGKTIKVKVRILEVRPATNEDRKLLSATHPASWTLN